MTLNHQNSYHECTRGEKPVFGTKLHNHKQVPVQRQNCDDSNSQSLEHLAQCPVTNTTVMPPGEEWDEAAKEDLMLMPTDPC